MAGASADEEADYWPGYVDALTAMVKVLTFVMMLLAVAVFAVSQKVAKQSLEAISKAVGVEIDPKAKPAEATAELVAKLKMRSEPALAKVEPEPPSTRTELLREPAASDPAVIVTAPEPAVVVTAPKPAVVVTAPEPAVAVPLPEPAATVPLPMPPAATPQIAALPQAAVPPEPPVAAEPERAKPEAVPMPRPAVIENPTDPNLPKPAAAAVAEAVDALITVKFKAAAVKVDATTSEEIGRRLKAAPSGDVARFVVRGYAETSGGAVSEGRRLAFYRAMMVRQTLVAHGIPADHIVLNVRDTARNGEGEVVKVSVQ